MSWITEAAKIYDLEEDIVGKNIDGITLLPLFHSTQKAQIQITIFDDGTFSHADVIDEEDSVTIIPVTEDSSSRSSGIAPHPLCDKLIYIAGDYSIYSNNKKAHEYFEAYLKQLSIWKNSKFGDKLIDSIYEYLIGGTVITDLIKQSILVYDDKENKFDSEIKIQKVPQSDCFVRFVVTDKLTNNSVKVWQSNELYNKYIGFCCSCNNDVQLCYATGEIVPVSYKHMSKIRNSGDKAKLISSNDTSNFTYRGRFANDTEAYSLGRVITQKAHLALRWLIQRSSTYVGTSVIVTWESKMNSTPDINKSIDLGIEELAGNFKKDEDDNIVAKTQIQYSQQISMAIKGYMKNLDFDSKIMVMSLDAATTGRLSVAMYQEFSASSFYTNLKKWYQQVCWHSVYFTKDKKRVDCVQTPTPISIVKYAYGTEQNRLISVDDKIKPHILLQIYLCIIQGIDLPDSIVRAIFIKASNPQCYSKTYIWESVLDVACALFRKYYIDKTGVEYNMELDRKNCNRSYLFGRLAAVADKAESDTFDNDEKRLTNAKRFMSSLIATPFKTWGYIYERIQPYMNKICTNNYGSYVVYEKEFEDITAKFRNEDYVDNSALDSMFFLGFYSQKQDLYTSHKNNNNTEGK